MGIVMSCNGQQDRILLRSSIPVVSLPAEIFLQIRKYLVTLQLMKEEYADSYERLTKEEQLRNWRNFLSMSNRESWKAIRQSTMIWLLNYYESMRYLEDDIFRVYLHERMVDPGLQLSCNMNTPYPLLRGDLLVTFDRLFMAVLHSLHVSDLFIEEIPSSNTLRVFSARDCKYLFALGTYPKLNFLTLYQCKQVVYVGKTALLTHLRLTPTKADLLGNFPLEQLEYLRLESSSLIPSFVSNFQRFRCLKELSLINPIDLIPVTTTNNNNTNVHVAHFRLPVLPFPDLHSLHIDSIESVNLNGLTALKTLKLKGVLENQVIGLNSVASQLTSYTLHENITSVNFNRFSSRGPFSNLQELEIIWGRIFVLFNDTNSSFPVHEKLTSLRLGLWRCNGLTGMSHKLTKVALSDAAITDLRQFRHCQTVKLVNCPQVTDISALQNVPILLLEQLPNLKDFSYLGKQKYLSIATCDGFEDKDAFVLENIWYVELFCCDGLTQLTTVENVRYLTVAHCRSLTKIELSGTEYISVFLDISSLDFELLITGKVYTIILNLTNSTITVNDGILENCRYQNLQRFLSDKTVMKKKRSDDYIQTAFSF
jgi:hypothetical protein